MAQDVSEMTAGALADEHRGQLFAKKRATERLVAIEGELDRRGLTSAKGKVGLIEKASNDAGLVDLKRMRAEEPELCARFALPVLWSSRTLKPHERDEAATVGDAR